MRTTIEESLGREVFADWRRELEAFSARTGFAVWKLERLEQNDMLADFIALVESNRRAATTPRLQAFAQVLEALAECLTIGAEFLAGEVGALAAEIEDRPEGVRLAAALREACGTTGRPSAVSVGKLLAKIAVLADDVPSVCTLRKVGSQAHAALYRIEFRREL